MPVQYVMQRVSWVCQRTWLGLLTHRGGYWFLLTGVRRFLFRAQAAQSVLFPERLDDWIHEDSTVRDIDVFVDELDLRYPLAPWSP